MNAEMHEVFKNDRKDRSERREKMVEIATLRKLVMGDRSLYPCELRH